MTKIDIKMIVVSILDAFVSGAVEDSWDWVGGLAFWTLTNPDGLCRSVFEGFEIRVAGRVTLSTESVGGGDRICNRIWNFDC